ncbi:MAG: DUF2067 family protein [Ignisphaera sp.]
MPKPNSSYIERSFSYSCNSVSQCLEILEKIDEELSLEADLQIEMRSNKLIIKVIGLEPNVVSAITKIRDFLSMYGSPKHDPRRGISSEIIVRYTKRMIPLDVLAYVLKKEFDIDAEVNGSLIYADTDLDTVITVAKKVAEVQQKIESMSYSSSLKKLLIAAVAIYNTSHVEIIEALQSLGYLNEKNELRIPWLQALEELDDIFNKNDV